MFVDYWKKTQCHPGGLQNTSLLLFEQTKTSNNIKNLNNPIGKLDLMDKYRNLDHQKFKNTHSSQVLMEHLHNLANVVYKTNIEYCKELA